MHRAVAPECRVTSASAPDPDTDGDRGEDVEDVLLRVRPAPFTTEVDDIEVIEHFAQVCSHPAHRLAAQVRRRGDEGDDAGPFAQLLGGTPGRPAPEVHIVVVEVLDVAALTSLAHGLRHRVEQRLDARDAVNDDPTAAFRGPAAVGRVPDDDREALPGLQRVGSLGLDRDRIVRRVGEERVVDQRRMAQRVGEQDRRLEVLDPH